MYKYKKKREEKKWYYDDVDGGKRDAFSAVLGWLQRREKHNESEVVVYH